MSQSLSLVTNNITIFIDLLVFQKANSEVHMVLGSNHPRIHVTFFKYKFNI